MKNLLFTSPAVSDGSFTSRASLPAQRGPLSSGQNPSSRGAPKTRTIQTALMVLTLCVGVCGLAKAQISGFSSGSGWTISSVNATGYNSNTAPGTGASSLPSLASGTAQLLPNRSFSGSGGTGAASSIFYNTAQPISAFNVSFTYQASGGGGSGIGDGLAFVVQRASPSALGAQNGNGATNLPASFTTAFSYNAATPGNDFILDGVSPVYSPTGALNLAGNQHPIKVTLSYNTITLYETITDTVTGTTYSTSKNVDINAVVGGQIGQTGQAAATTAYVGFTAGSSASFAGVTISNFTFTPVTVPGIQFIPKPIVPNGWGSCVAPNGYGGDYYQQTGVNGDEYFSPSQQAFFQASGMTLIRADLTWDNVEFSKGVYNWNYYDGLINNLQGTGINVMFILDYNNPLYPSNVYQQPALGGYANFAAAAAKHFQGKNVFFEIWNEPNFAYGFNGSQYSTFAVAAEQAMRAAVPNVTIIGPAEGESDPVFREQMLSTGGGNFLNAFSFHPYVYPESALYSNGYQGGFPAVAADLVAYPPSSGVPLPMMASESGTAGDTLQNQASIYTRIYLDDQLFGLALNTAYKYQDGQPADNNPANNDYGLIYADNTAKPAYTAVKNLISSLNGYEQIGQVNTGNSNLYASIYQKGASLAEAIWSSNSPGDSALPYIHYLTTGSAEYNQILNAVYANSSAVIAPPSFTTQFTVTAPATSVGGVPRGTPFQVTVRALDEYNNPTPNYNGTVHFTSTDSSAVLPADATLTNGVGTFVVTLNTAAWEYVTATDTATPSITNAFAGLVTTAHTLASSMNPLTISQGTSTQSTLSVILGYSQNATLSLSGLPTGVTATLSNTSFTADGTCFLTLSASNTTPLGSYSLQVNATSGSTTKTLTIPLTVGAGTGLPTGGFLATGQYIVSPSGVCYLTQQSDGNLVLYSGSGPANKGPYIWGSQALAGGGVFCTVMQPDGNLVTITGPSPGQSTGAIWASGTYNGTNYTLNVLDTQVVQIVSGTNVIWQEPANQVPTYAVSVASGSMSVNRGASETNTIAVNYLSGFSGNVTLSATNLPTGVTASFSPASFTASGNSLLTLAVSPTASPGTSSFTVQTTSGSTTRTLTIPLTIGAGSMLSANTFLASGQYIVSPSGDCYLIQEADGNLALYGGSGPANKGTSLWSSNTHGTASNYFTIMQTDGNLVTYAGPAGSSSNPVWNSATYFGGANAFLEITDSQSLLLYSAADQLLWGEPTQTLTPWQGWRLRNFAGSQLVDNSVSGILAQPAGDGCTNLVKYATGLSPLVSAPASAYMELSGDASGGPLAFTYRHDTAATDVSLQVEQSTDLLTWTPASGTPAVVAVAGTVQTLRLTIPVSSPRTFLRLIVDAP